MHARTVRRGNLLRKYEIVSLCLSLSYDTWQIFKNNYFTSHIEAPNAAFPEHI